MAPSQSAQLENIIDEVLKNGNVRPLDMFLERETDKETSVKCTRKFLTKLDKLVSMSLDRKDVRTVSLGLAIIFKCGKNLKLPDGQGLSGFISQGLIKKMVQWFDKCQLLWIQHGPCWDQTLFTVSENFLNALMVVHESCKEGTYKVTESFLYPIGQLAVNPRIYILIQKEAIRKFNLILDKIPAELKKNKKILTSQEASDIMIKLAAQILEGGDYDLQSSLMEALCRMATPVQRKKFANRWFGMAHVASAFAQISDSEFETACRRFLNMVNGMQGDRRRVCSYPCLEVYLGNFELLMPADEKLEEFWIDFNLGSHSISFYFSLPDEEESHWETICICENEVQSYTVTEEGKNQILQIKLSEVVVVGAVEGSSLAIHFSSSLDILQAVQNVYGHIKNKCTPVVKKTGKTMMQRNGTQVVPESQVSLSEAEKNSPPCVLSAQTGPGQMATPGKMRMSESTVYISSSGRGTVNSISSLALKPSTRDRDRTPLEKDCTPSGSTKVVGITNQKIRMAEAKHAVVTGEEEEKSQDHYFVPDTQPRTGRAVSSWSKLSVSEMLMMPTQKIGSLPSPELNSSVVGQTEQGRSSAQRYSVSESSIVLQKQLHSELTQRLQQVLDERNKDPQYLETSALQKTIKSSTENLKNRSSGSLGGPLLCTPKIHQVQRNTCATGESKGQLALEADSVPSVKVSTAKTVLDKKESKLKDDSKMTILRKEKREVEITGSMMKIISNRYENNTRTPTKDTAENTQNWVSPSVNRSIFNMSMFSFSKKELQKTVSQRKPLNKSTKNSVKQSKDIFAFNMDSPVHIGGKNKTFDTSTSGIHSSPQQLSTNKKPQIELVANNKRNVKKHLFSDTDTDTAPTEVSWLRESARRSKPEINKYPRQALMKPKTAHPQTHFADKSHDFLPSAQKATKDSKKPIKKGLDQPKMVKQTAALSKPHAAGRRPKRTAATATKSYRDPDTDSQSETEGPPALKCSSTDNLKNTEKTDDAAQTKKKMTISKQSIKIKLQPEALKSKIQIQHVGQQDDSEEMCFEIPQVKKRKDNQPAESYRKQDGSTLQDLKKKPGLKVVPEKDPQETLKMDKKNGLPAREQMSALKDSLAACQTSFCPSPPSTEKMRSAERSAPTLDLTCSTVLTPQGSPLPASPKPPHQETPSLIPLLPKLLSKVSSKEKGKVMSFYKAEKNYNSSKTQSIQSVPSPCSLEGQSPPHGLPTGPSAEQMCTIQQHLSSAAQSPLFPSTQPLLTSTLRDLDKLPVASHCPSPSPLPEDTASQGCDLDFSKVSSVSLALYRRSSVLSGKSKDGSTGATTESTKSERTPVTDRDLELTQSHVSGPSRKRHVSSVSNSEEDEKEEKKKCKIRALRSPRMKPRKLFKSCKTQYSCVDQQPETVAEVSTVDELSQISSVNWEAERVDGDKGINLDVELSGTVLNPRNLVDQLSSDMKNKFQKRCKTVEMYNKQTLKTVQQHVSSINTQLSKCRTQKLEQVQKVLLEEIHSMEEDNNMLKNMEKDLNIHWKKHMVAFHSYQKQEVRRNDTLKRTLKTNAFQSFKSEEEIFTSEMEVLREGMKSVQDRLLSEMLEGEIQGVKKGLQALFFP